MMVNSAVLFTANDAIGWSGGEILGNPEIRVFSVEVDSRKCTEGSLFIALKGENVDGHDFLQAAFDNGACGAAVSAEWYSLHKAEVKPVPAERFIIAAEDPLSALQQIASGYMKRITGPVRIGVTGSSGKTTTKELIAAVLGEKYNVVKTGGNYNSEIGLPLTVFNIKNTHEYAVIEMGINRVGEMDVLAEILRPDMVVITNIGTAHIGIFKNIEKTAYEKRRSVSLFAKQGVLFVDEEESFGSFLGEGHSGTTISYGFKSFKSESENLQCKDCGLEGWVISFDDVEIKFPLIGIHNLKNAFGACAVGRYAGLSSEQLKAGLEKAVPLSGRSQIINGPVTIIQDCYNANADSLNQSVKFADSLEWDGSKIYVLGDMKELGENSRDIHTEAGRTAAASSADKVFFFGEDSAEAYREAASLVKNAGPELYYTSEYSELEKNVLSGLQRGDLLLIKGSRSMNLERLLEPVANIFVEEKC